MKKNVTLALAILLGVSIQAQNKNKMRVQDYPAELTKTQAFIYSFTALTGQTYTEFTGGTDINGGQTWDDPDVRVALPFTMQLVSMANFDSLDFSAGFGGAVGAIKYSTLKAGILLPFDADLIDRGYLGTTSQSFITYTTTGTAPNRIFKIQWKNCGSYDELSADSTTADFVNFQMWLYEGSAIIEYRFGPQAINDPTWWYTTGLLNGLVGFNLATQTLEDIHLLTGNPSSPTLTDQLLSLTGHPGAGVLYRFTPTTVSVDELEKLGVEIYPNPATDFLHVDSQFEMADFSLISINGAQVRSGKITAGKIDVSDLMPGVYVLNIKGSDNNLVYRFVKQ
jgi:hypothetical protein